MRILLETVQERNAKPFSEGHLAMCVINVDDPVNRHYLNEYPIISNSISLVRRVHGEVSQSKNLEDVWESHRTLMPSAFFLKTTSMDTRRKRIGPGPARMERPALPGTINRTRGKIQEASSQNQQTGIQFPQKGNRVNSKFRFQLLKTVFYTIVRRSFNATSLSRPSTPGEGT